MLHIEKWKIALTALLCVLGLAYAVPNLLSAERQQWLATTLPQWMPHKTVSLGLDLQGGSHLLLEADTATVIAERMDAFADTAKRDLNRAKIGYADMAARKDGVSFRLRDPAQDRDEAYKVARAIDERASVTANDDGEVNIVFSEKVLGEMRAQIVNQSIEIVRRRVDGSGTKEPIIQRQGTQRIVLQLPGEGNPERIKKLLGETAKMTFHLPDPDAEMGARRVGPMSMLLPMNENPGQMMAVRKRIMLTGDSLVDSQPTFDDMQRPAVSFRFDTAGAKRFCEITRENIGKPFVIVLDKKVLTAPVIQTAICAGSGVITGQFTTQETADLSLLLRAGALPAELKVVEERTVGPTLGSDSVEAGKKATMYAFALVCVMMVAFYGLFGFFAAIALAFNMAFIFAVLSLLQATLTLPGIAGIVLTIGMAVDANVLVYERIREELRNGRSTLSSVDAGYKHAMSTIVDSNLTTLIVAIILFSFGTGPVKGFAVSMSIGIVTSMFSAIMITRIMIVAWLRKTRPSKIDL